MVPIVSSGRISMRAVAAEDERGASKASDESRKVLRSITNLRCYIGDFAHVFGTPTGSVIAQGFPEPDSCLGTARGFRVGFRPLSETDSVEREVPLRGES